MGTHQSVRRDLAVFVRSCWRDRLPSSPVTPSSTGSSHDPGSPESSATARHSMSAVAGKPDFPHSNNINHSSLMENTQRVKHADAAREHYDGSWEVAGAGGTENLRAPVGLPR